jgi:ABC-type bacteriocin/lantibiotic exporter with double-glycine peptidase domain
MHTTWLNVPLFSQNDRANCLPTCVEMVSAFFGRPVKRAWLRSVLETSEIGNPGFKLRNLRRRGYEVTYAPATDERALTTALSAGIPPIVLLHTTHLPYWTQETSHAVVVIALDANSAVLNDPAFSAAPQSVSRQTFLLAWSDFDYLYALIRPTV